MEPRYFLYSTVAIIFQVLLKINSEHLLENSDKSVKILCQNGTAELIFILDASTSVTQENFHKELSFVKRSTELLPVRADTIRVALITYSTKVMPHINLTSNSTQSEFVHKLNGIAYDKGETFTRSALVYVRTNILTTSRPNVPQIIILVTDGRSSIHQDGSPIPVANQMKQNGVKIIVVGVSKKIDENELVSIASKDSFFKISDFDQLKSIYRNIARETCISIKTTPQPPIFCEKNQLEAIFLIDSSQSISQRDFKSELQFVREFVKVLTIEKDAVRMALLSFHDDVNIVFNLNTYNSKKDLIEAIKKVPHHGGGTSIGRALRIVRTSVLPLARPLVPRVIILITDGKNTGVYRPLKEARLLKSEKNTKIIVVGVSDKIDLYELKEISSSGKIHRVQSFKHLVRQVNLLLRDACE